MPFGRAVKGEPPLASSETGCTCPHEAGLMKMFHVEHFLSGRSDGARNWIEKPNLPGDLVSCQVERSSAGPSLGANLVLTSNTKCFSHTKITCFPLTLGGREKCFTWNIFE